MKLRLIQNSHDKTFAIQYWGSGPLHPSLGISKEYWKSIFPGDYNNIRGFYPADQEQLANSEFNKLVDILTSKEIVLKEVDTAQ